ncbi:MAG: DUF4252 domain-containing protein [Pyrinomonadaceae bacterium]|nr:DUF4252 domain-containing protein [Pyrinomonadaceae bacterium]
MKLPIKYTISMLLLFVLTAITAVSAQNARLQFDNLKGLEDRAEDVIEVNIDGKLLKLAKRVLVKVKDKDAKTVGEAIKGLEGIYVRVYNFKAANEYDIADIETIRAQLKSPGWEKLANVRSKKNNQKIDVYTMFTGDVMSGVAVILSEDKSIALVNVIGPIDIDTLVELGGNWSIPEINIEKTEENNDGTN